MKAGAARGIEAVVKAINTHISNIGVCYAGCGIFCYLTKGKASFQKEVCEKGGLDTLLRVLRLYTINMSLLSLCCTVIWLVLSSPEIHSEYCTSKVIRAVEECHEKHKYSEILKKLLLTLKREEDPRVCDAVSRGVCISEAFPKCGWWCKCDENVYCSKCCVQQKVFRCLTCDKNKNRFYCEVCWKKDHQGHQGEEFFCPARCATGHK